MKTTALAALMATTMTPAFAHATGVAHMHSYEGVFIGLGFIIAALLLLRRS